MEEFVTDKLKPLDSEIGTLTAYVKKTKEDISKKQTFLSNLLEIQQLATSSKSNGSRPDYEKLKKISGKNIYFKVEGKKINFQTLANAALRDIFFYFDSQMSAEGRILGDPISKKLIEYTVDELIDIYHNTDPSFDIQESAINTLAKLKRETAVQEICDSLNKEQNLRVVARMIRALRILTGAYFESLDINAVKTWWAKNQNQEKYKPCYKGYLEALAYIRKKSSLSDEESKYVISLLDKTIEMDPHALHARCLRAAYLANLGEYDDADIELKEVEERNDNYRWLYYYKAELSVWRENYDKAIESLNQAMSISASIATQIKNALIFKDVITNPKLNWPSEKIE